MQAGHRRCDADPAILWGMMRSAPGKAAAVSAVPSSAQRLPGVGPSALALAALLAIGFVQNLMEPWHRWLGATGAWWGYRALFGFELLAVCLGHGLAVICLWQYWKGRSWARLLVLLWSFATVAWALSFLAEHNFDPAALMGRPLSFFQAVLAVVLLYWLNTPQVRAWYKKGSADAGDQIADRLRGRLCTGVELHADAGIWHVCFEHDAELILCCPWRIVLDDNLAFASTHDGDPSPADLAPRSAFVPLTNQQPPQTVPAPGHLPQEARRLLENLRVRGVRLAPRSSDLFVSFEMGIELQTWSTSSPKPGPAPLWKYSDPALTVMADEAKVHAQVFTAPDAASDRP